MTTLLPVERQHGTMTNIWTEAHRLHSCGEHERLRQRLKRDVEKFLSSGGKIQYIESSLMVDCGSHQTEQSKEANRRRAINNKPLSSRQEQTLRLMMGYADKDGWVKISEVYKDLSDGERGNIHQYVQKIHDKGFIRRGEKRGYVRIIRVPNDAVSAKEGAR